LPLTRKRLFIIGDGPLRESLARYTQRAGVDAKTVLTGFRDDRLDFLRGLDALVLPSALEGIPRCLMEAMAAGVPVISSDIPGSRDLVSDGQTGLLFPVGDAGALRACLERLAADTTLRERLASAAKHRVEERFSATGMATGYLHLFQALTAGGEPTSGAASAGARTAE
jgi:glycosyltransferase involved in cell wall biosynthesis